LSLDSGPKIIQKVMNGPLKFGKINADRAFAYRKKDVKKEFDYNKLIERIKNRL